jgi:pyruvate formate lyase activating enzyme
VEELREDPAEIGKLIGFPTVHKAYLVDRTYGTRTVRCGVCRQACEIPEGQTGFCRTRLNIGGELQTLTYGDVIACESRPVEIKPFFHFHPGASMMTICGPSCNLRCPCCQNHRLSRAAPRPLKAERVQMLDVIEAARAAGDIGVCVSFTEPLMLFEYCLGLFREAAARGMVSSFVSNGYMTGEALLMLARAGLNAMKVDIKGSDRVYREYCGGKHGDRPAWETVQGALDLGVHVEVVYLVITGLNDNEQDFLEICRKHLEYAAPDVPLHLTTYHPAFEYQEQPTSVDFLEWAYFAARRAGLLFPYLGNVPGHALANTYCPQCGELLLERSVSKLERDLTDRFNCRECGYSLPIVS